MSVSNHMLIFLKYPQFSNTKLVSDALKVGISITLLLNIDMAMIYAGSVAAVKLKRR